VLPSGGGAAGGFIRVAISFLEPDQVGALLLHFLLLVLCMRQQRGARLPGSLRSHKLCSRSAWQPWLQLPRLPPAIHTVRQPCHLCLPQVRNGDLDTGAGGVRQQKQGCAPGWGEGVAGRVLCAGERRKIDMQWGLVGRQQPGRYFLQLMLPAFIAPIPIPTPALRSSLLGTALRVGGAVAVAALAYGALSKAGVIGKKKEEEAAPAGRNGKAVAGKKK